MANLSIKEVHTEEDYFKLDDDPEVTIAFGSTDKTYQTAEAVLSIIKPKKIIQNRDSKAIYYETFILSDYYSVKIKSGFTSGYGGEGARGFQKLLEKCGIPEEESEEFITSREYQKAVLTAELD